MLLVMGTTVLGLWVPGNLNGNSLKGWWVRLEPDIGAPIPRLAPLINGRVAHGHAHSLQGPPFTSIYNEALCFSGICELSTCILFHMDKPAEYKSAMLALEWEDVRKTWFLPQKREKDG